MGHILPQISQDPQGSFGTCVTRLGLAEVFHEKMRKGCGSEKSPVWELKPKLKNFPRPCHHFRIVELLHAECDHMHKLASFTMRGKCELWRLSRICVRWSPLQRANYMTICVGGAPTKCQPWFCPIDLIQTNRPAHMLTSDNHASQNAMQGIILKGGEVVETIPGSFASRHIKAGDIISSVDGGNISRRDVIGVELPLTIFRDGALQYSGFAACWKALAYKEWVSASGRPADIGLCRATTRFEGRDAQEH